MRVIIERAGALAALARVQGVVNRSNTIPILQNVLLEAKRDGLRFTATDMDQAITAEAVADVAEPGSITVPASTLYDILRNLPTGGEVSMAFEAPRLIVKCARSVFRLPSLPAGDFPVFPQPAGGVKIDLPAKVLARLFDKTSFCMSKEETRYYIRTLYLAHVVVDGVAYLRAVATDGNRLAYAQTPAPEGLEPFTPILLPDRTVGEMRRLVDGQGGDAELVADDAKVRLSCGGASIVSKLIDANYPDYERVVPRDLNRRVGLDAALFGAAVKRVALMGSTGKMQMVRLSLSDGQVRLTSRNGEGGEGEEVLEADVVGEPVELSFNAGFLLEIVGRMDGEALTFEAGGANDPAKILDPADPHAVFVIMPLRA